MFGDRLRQLDVRVSKLFRVADRRFQFNVDLYNAMNGSTASRRSRRTRCGTSTCPCS